jgi:hypothetical protein
MSWTTITEAKFLEQCAGPEVTAIKSAALGTGQSEPLTATIAKVVQEVRGYVAACAQNRLDSDTSKIPAELEADAIAIVRYRALNRLNVRSLLSESRAQEYRDALDKLKMVAACKFALEQPTDVSTQVIPSGSAAEVVTSTTRQSTRSNLAGL